MSAKENAAVSQLLELLEARYALRVLWALKDGHPQTFRLLQDSVGNITPNTLNTRIKELRAAGQQKSDRGGRFVFAEPAGQRTGHESVAAVQGLGFLVWLITHLPAKACRSFRRLSRSAPVVVTM